MYMLYVNKHFLFVYTIFQGGDIPLSPPRKYAAGKVNTNLTTINVQILKFKINVNPRPENIFLKHKKYVYNDKNKRKLKLFRIPIIGKTQ